MATPAWASRGSWTARPRRGGAAGACLVFELGSPFHVNAGFSPVRALVEGRCGIGEDTPATERLDCLTSELQSWSSTSDRLVRLLAPILDIDPSAGYQDRPRPRAASSKRKSRRRRRLRRRLHR